MRFCPGQPIHGFGGQAFVLFSPVIHQAFLGLHSGNKDSYPGIYLFRSSLDKINDFILQRVIIQVQHPFYPKLSNYILTLSEYIVKRKNAFLGNID